MNESRGSDSKLMEMLTGYASAHQHPFNVAIHLIGIPTIMLGVFIILSCLGIDLKSFTINGAHVATLVLFIFYLTIDRAFSFAFLFYAVPVALLASYIGALPTGVSGSVAAANAS